MIQVHQQDRCVPKLFEAQAVRTPRNVAVVDGERRLTYSALNARANQLAHYLQKQGIGQDTLVGIFAERSLEAIIGILAVLKAGGAYVPLDPAYPEERLSFMIEDTGVSLLLAQRRFITQIRHKVNILCLDAATPEVDCQSKGNPVNAAAPSDLAYVIYTSGSTGKPKGVMICHKGLSNHMNWMLSAFPIADTDGVLQNLSLSFDPSVWQIFFPLLAGARLILASPQGHMDSDYLIRTVMAEKVTIFNVAPSLLHVLLEQEGFGKCTSLKRVFCGGEAFPFELQKRFFEKMKAELYNMYGPTEATITSLFWKCSNTDSASSAGVVPIGRPIANTRVYILDKDMQPVSAELPGELYIGGAGLGKGYLNRPELTAERFIRDPFSAEPDARLYKTGDLAKFRRDGTVEFLGRIDHQVKIRGFRIELGEIEAVLQAHPAIQMAVVIVREDTYDDKRLAAYYIIRKNAEAVTTEHLRNYLSSRLPEYMLPSSYMLLDTFPQTPSGKIDRKALPVPDADAYVMRAYEAPEGSLEVMLSRIWSELLGIERVGRRDHFFDLGGHSLLAVKMIEQVRRKGFEMDVRALFTTPTLMDLAAAIDVTKVPVKVPPNSIFPGCDRITPELLPLVTLGQGDIDRIVASTPGGAVNIQDIYPLAPLQEGIFFHHLMDSRRDVYLLFSLLAFDSREMIDSFLSAFQAVIDRHDVLRTAIFWEGLPEPVQVVWRKARMVVEQAGLDPSAGDAAEQMKFQLGQNHYQIDIRKAPMIHAFIACDDTDGRWLLALHYHHLVIDHTTMEILEEEIRAHLFSKASSMPAALPFRDFVAQVRMGVGRDEHEAFFRKMLADVEEPTAPFGLLDVRGDGSDINETRLPLDLQLCRQFRKHARILGVSPATLFHLAWARVLASLCGHDDVVFGTVLIGRMQGGSGADRVMGMFLNTLPVRIAVRDKEVKRAVKDIHRLLAELLYHEHASLSLAQQCSSVPSAMPLFSSLLNYRHRQQKSLFENMDADWDGIQLLYAEERTNYPLVLAVDDLGEGFELVLHTRMPIEPIRIFRFVNTAITRLVEALEQTPDVPMRSIEVIPHNELRQMLFGWNNTDTQYPKDECVHQVFERLARQSPNTTAVEFGNERLTYGELNTKANQLAHFLRSKGVKPGAFVCLYMERSIEIVIGLLGILKAGGAYVPLDPSYPDERLTLMLEESKSPLLLTQQKFSKKLMGQNIELLCLDTDRNSIRTMDDTCPEIESGSDNVAYIIYTSGSTGRPKGVCVPHRAINRLAINTNYITLTASDRVAFASNTSFDAATFEIWGALLNGGCLVGVSREDLLSPKRYGEKLREKRITTSFLTTALFNQIAAELPSVFESLDNLLFGGEAVEPKWVREVLQKGAPKRLLHVYGPTENTTFSTWYEVKAVPENAVTIPIGKPISNSKCYILDKHLNPVPIGVSGELFLGGQGLAKGYYLQTDLTAVTFIRDPYSDSVEDCIYKTGDIARYLPDGNIEFVGRVDNQVKLRGFRIELGEIETAIKSHSFVNDAVAVMREDRPGDKRIVAYMVLKPGEKINGMAIRGLLQAQLPDYMIPSAFVTLDTMPLTKNGKVDRKVLPLPGPTDLKNNHTAPRTPAEEALSEIWSSILNIDAIGIHDNFFNLGGHSLMATSIVSRMNQAFGMTIPVRAIFEHPTISSLSEYLSHLQTLLQQTQPFGSPLSGDREEVSF